MSHPATKLSPLSLFKTRIAVLSLLGRSIVDIILDFLSSSINTLTLFILLKLCKGMGFVPLFLQQTTLLYRKVEFFIYFRKYLLIF